MPDFQQLRPFVFTYRCTQYLTQEMGLVIHTNLPKLDAFVIELSVVAIYTEQ